MADDPCSIDVSSLAELVRIRQEEEILRSRLEKMELSRERVSHVVYRRVREDYEKRKAVLDAEAREPRDQAGRQYARLHALVTEAEKALEEARFQNEEMDFRHELGEFVEGDYKERLGGCQARLSERQQALDKLMDLKREFQNAFSSEEELERAASEFASEAATAPEAVPDAAPGVVTSVMATMASPPTSPDTTLVSLLPPARRGAPGSPGAVPPILGPRLILLVDDKPERDFFLKREEMSIGRASGNDIHVPYPDVSRVHASISPEGDSRFKVADRGSPNGIIVNGELVKEHLLSDGDIIQVGRRKLVFRA
jgi:FHA domain